MTENFNFRTKVLIIFIIFTVLTIFKTEGWLPFGLVNILRFLLLFSSLIFFIRNTEKSRKTAYILVTIYSLSILLILLSDLRYISSDRYQNSLLIPELTNILLTFIDSLIPIVILIVTLSNLKNYDNKKFDFLIGSLLLILFLSSGYFDYLFLKISGETQLIITNDLYNYINVLFTGLFYVSILFIWHRTDEVYITSPLNESYLESLIRKRKTLVLTFITLLIVVGFFGFPFFFIFLLSFYMVPFGFIYIFHKIFDLRYDISEPLIIIVTTILTLLFFTVIYRYLKNRNSLSKLSLFLYFFLIVGIFTLTLIGYLLYFIDNFSLGIM